MSKKYYEFRPDDEVAQPSDVTSDTSHLKSEGVANQYSSTSAYAVGDFCMYEGKAYMCNTAIASPGETWTAAHWTLANLSSLFTSANTSLTGLLPYPTNTAVTILDRNINVVSSGAFVIPAGFTDLLIRFTGTPTSLTFTDSGITDYGDDLPSESGDYLITVTKTDTDEAFIRVVKMEERS